MVDKTYGPQSLIYLQSGPSQKSLLTTDLKPHNPLEANPGLELRSSES